MKWNWKHWLRWGSTMAGFFSVFHLARADWKVPGPITGAYLYGMLAFSVAFQVYCLLSGEKFDPPPTEQAAEPAAPWGSKRPWLVVVMVLAAIVGVGAVVLAVMMQPERPDR